MYTQNEVLLLLRKTSKMSDTKIKLGRFTIFDMKRMVKLLRVILRAQQKDGMLGNVTSAVLF
jgi:hypothetical protein